METEKALLQIQDLTVAYRHGHRWLEAVREFVLDIKPGQTYGLVGESGSGKSTIALTIMRYLRNGRSQQGEIWFNGRDLLTLNPSQMASIWGREISLVPQDPLSALNPSIRIGEQIAEVLRQHMHLDKTTAAQRAVTLLEMVRLPDPPRVAASYPHQLSGGMQQRVMIAMALCTEPLLLILDEPTTNLDVTTQAAVLDLLQDLVAARQTAVLYVTHNLGVVARVCDRVAVLYAGELVEDAPTYDLYQQPLHPYTQGLLDSVPQLGQNKSTVQLQAIPGQIPSLGQRPSGCVFAPRCPLVLDKCHQERPSLDAREVNQHTRLTRCHRWTEILTGEISAKREEREEKRESREERKEEELLQLDELKVYFEANRSLTQVLTGKAALSMKAVDGISLQAGRQQTLGLVGESGSGKTTLARAIIGLVKRTSGDIKLHDMSLPATVSHRDKNLLQHLQYIFQNPEEALNPYLTVGETLKRPFITLAGKTPQEANAAAHELLRAVSLPVGYAQRLPSQLSGGEKQRVAIARAFATNPDLLIADEAVSALDVSVQASILNLLSELQTEHNNTLLFISHDLAVVGYLADKIAVVYIGQLMEVAAAVDLFAPPYHPYTEALLSAIPMPNATHSPETEQTQIRLEGDIPSQILKPSGCPFHPRCPRYLGDICTTETPPWQTLPNNKRIFCHIPVSELQQKQERTALLETEDYKQEII